MRTFIYFFIILIFLIPSNCYSNEWFRVYKGSNTFVKTFSKDGVCQVIFKENKIIVGVITSFSCSNMQQTLLIKEEGKISRESYFYRDSCCRDDPKVDIFKKYCLNSDQKELPDEIQQWLRKY